MIPEKDNKRFKDIVFKKVKTNVIVLNYRYGYWIEVTEANIQNLIKEGFSDELINLMREAQKVNSKYLDICFDGQSYEFIKNIPWKKED